MRGNHLDASNGCLKGWPPFFLSQQVNLIDDHIADLAQPGMVLRVPQEDLQPLGRAEDDISNARWR